MKYICTNCNYIFDESLDLIEDTKILNKVENYESCPVCDEPDTFIWVEEEVNYIYKDSFWYLENEHIPEIEYVDDEKWVIKVTVWKQPHTMWKDHRIISISLLDEYWDLIIEEFLPEEGEPEAEFDINDIDEYEIRVRCSNHWMWWKKFIK